MYTGALEAHDQNLRRSNTAVYMDLWAFDVYIPLNIQREVVLKENSSLRSYESFHLIRCHLFILQRFLHQLNTGSFFQISLITGGQWLSSSIGVL